MKTNKSKVLGLALGLVLTFGASTIFAQDSQVRSLQNGQKAEISGVVVERNGDVLLLRDDNGVQTYVRLTDATSVKSKGSFLRTGKKYAETNIVRGLLMEAEGVGDNAGQLVASKVRFRNDDLRVAKTVNSRVNPVEGRVSTAEERLTQSEQNAQRLSGQLDELVAVSNAARGGAKAAQDTADSAVKGVNDTNARISSLDDYAVQTQATILFKVGNSKLTAEGTGALDQIAQAAQASKGYVVEVTGFTDASGNAQANRVLSQKRADAVIRYLVETHGIPLRRILTPYGYGESNAVAENTTRDGRAQNRRVEVKLLVNGGINQNVTINNPTANQ